MQQEDCMTESSASKAEELIHAYLELPHDEYARLVEDLKRRGGLSAEEVRTLKDRLPFIHGETIIRQVGLESGE